MLRAQNAAAIPVDEQPQLTINDAADLVYFTEGAANVLYRYVGADNRFKTHLIRLRKYLPNFPTTLQLYTHLHKVFVPLLPSSILDTKLVELSPAVLKTLNARLQQNDRGSALSDGMPRLALVPGKRKGRLDESEIWGLIVEDMTPGVYQKYNSAVTDTPRRTSGHDRPSFFPPRATLEPDEMEARALSQAGWRDLLTVEFKPKYLVQSPDAPPDWKLCRTCALRSMRSRTLSGHSTASAGSNSEAEDANGIRCPLYCPLDLVSPNPTRVRHAVEAIVGRDDGVLVVDEEEALVSDPALGEDGVSPWLDILDTTIVDLLTSYFSDAGSLTHVLADLQAHFGGKVGVLAPPTPTLEVSAEELSRMLAGHPTTAKIGEDICTAMSLRDCTVYVRIWVRPKTSGSGIDVHIECKVGDLDMKTGEGGKGVYWREVEKRLLRGDWYTGCGVLEGPGCREQTDVDPEDEFTDYVLTTASADSKPTELLRNGSSDSFQLSSDFLKAPKTTKASRLSESTAAA
ncbi:Inositol-pentakisphosphate 2-kinase [Orbilia brochopaga]|uniref:Inositol-pentakisphosphate 2-kinase n=1 Tax=Orbilia brochopaga TaxID=3140254 RepID=A0AAV9UGA5_9PEZI